MLMVFETIADAPRVVRYALPVLLAVGAGCLLAAILLPPPGTERTDGEKLAHEVPDFQLTERSGQPVSKDDLRGKVWVASFVFVKCTGPCPSVSATMARLQSELDLANSPDLRLVSVTVDPARDTLEDLKKYADHYRAHPERWLFLRAGSEDEVHKLAKDGFFLGVNRSKEANPTPGQEFDHSTMLAVVDKRGRVRDHFDGFRGEHDTDGSKYAASFERLKAIVAELLRE